MVNRNIAYKSKQLLEFYITHRRKWSEFYPSERWVLQRIAGAKKNIGDVLDVGCACAGLGSALREKFRINSYTGIDIHKEAISWARNNVNLCVPVTFIWGDILKVNLGRDYDIVVSLSCADWNIETKKIINACWNMVRQDGYFVISLRLTQGKGINDMEESYQYINFSAKKRKSEVANYVVFNSKESINMIKGLLPHPQLIGAYGYWGKPSLTAVTPFDKLIFTVFYIKKDSVKLGKKIKYEFNLPRGVFL